MGWFKFAEDGSCRGYSWDDKKPGSSGIWWQYDGSFPINTEHAMITAAIDDGVVTAVTIDSVFEIYAHINISGGDGKVPPGIIDNDPDSMINVAIKISKSASDPNAGLPGDYQLTESFRIILRQDDGRIYDVRNINIIDNNWVGVYRSEYGPGSISIEQRDIEDIIVPELGIVKIKLIGDSRIKIYKNADIA